MISSLFFVELGKALSKPVSLDPGNRIICGVENGLGAAEYVGCDVVFI